MPRPVCFMVMPYSIKDTRSANPKAPARINCDLLWDHAFSPALDALGYEPVRADQDLGALIIAEMIQRLALADLVVADVTVPNGNVYYELGLRHALKNAGCVLTAADWSEQLFDIEQMRQIRYPLPEQDVSEAAAASIQTILKESIPGLATGLTPLYQTLPKYPVIEYDEQHVTAFRDTLRQLAAFQAEVKQVRSAGSGTRKSKARDLARATYSGGPVLNAVALELMYLLRDSGDWQDVLDFIDSLPGDARRIPVMQEQRGLALAKLSDPDQAIGVLEQLMASHGETPERRGLIGGRYKQKMRAAANEADKARFLEAAIVSYEEGMYLDLNEYYCSSNLARLYRQRNEDEDTDKASLAAAVTEAACEKAVRRGGGDEWLKPTLLGSAFEAGHIDKAKKLATQVRKEGHASWKLESAIADLEASAAAHDPATAGALQTIVVDLKKLLV